MVVTKQFLLGGPIHVFYAAVSSFFDHSSADRAANAFRHAAELCGKTQPF